MVPRRGGWAPASDQSVAGASSDPSASTDPSGLPAAVSGREPPGSASSSTSASQIRIRDGSAAPAASLGLGFADKERIVSVGLESSASP